METTNNATKFLKKLFCIEGTSPDNLTNNPINAKQNAAEIIHIMPFTLEFINLPHYTANKICDYQQSPNVRAGSNAWHIADIISLPYITFF